MAINPARILSVNVGAVREFEFNGDEILIDEVALLRKMFWSSQLTCQFAAYFPLTCLYYDSVGVIDEQSNV